MRAFADILIAFVAIQHLIFLILEMFLWTKPLGLKIFKQTRETAEASAILAKNQGLYNGFLAAGLVWSLLSSDASQAFAFKVFFLVYVIVAGIFGGMTADLSILFVQAVPAAAALGLLLF